VAPFVLERSFMPSYRTVVKSDWRPFFDRMS
jgi:hypothetical protein